MKSLRTFHVKRRNVKSEQREIGDIGEAIACRFLVKRGYTIVEKNYLKKWGEIDIVAKDIGILHFIEVKTLKASLRRRASHLPFGRKLKSIDKNVSREKRYNPVENVHPKKLERLHKTILSYLEERKVSQETEWQIDVAAVVLDLNSKVAEIDFIENIV